METGKKLVLKPMEKLCQFLHLTLGLVLRSNPSAIKHILANYELFSFIQMSFTPWLLFVQDIFDSKLKGLFIDMSEILTQDNLAFILKFIK